MSRLMTALTRAHHWVKAPLHHATRRLRRASDTRAAQELDYIASQFEQMGGDADAVHTLRQLATARRSLVS